MKLILEIDIDDPGRVSIIKEQVDQLRTKLESKSTNGVTCNVRVVNPNSKYGAPTTKQINYAKSLIKRGKVFVSKETGEMITDPELMTGEEIYQFIKENPPKNSNYHRGGGYQPSIGLPRPNPPTSGSNAFHPIAHTDYNEDDLPF